MKKYIMAIDHGTTSTRAILFDKKANVVGISQKETSIRYPHPGWVEQDANEIWLAVLSVMSEVVLKTNVKPEEVASIGISNQRETTVLWDSKTGMPVSDAIVWQSKQTKDICQEWKEKGYEDIIHQKTGLCIDPYFSASKIVWLYEQNPSLRDNSDILFGTMDSWIVYKLTGGKVHITDVSNASRTLLYNIHDLKWDDELLQLFDIPKSILPNVMPTSYCYANCESYHFFGQEVPICSVVGDQQAALFGQGCFSKGMVKNTYGTGGFMLMNTGHEIVDSKNGLLSTVAWKIGEDVKYALEGSMFVSGSLLKWLKNSLKIIENYKDTNVMAESCSDTNGVVIVPAFVGLGAPYWLDDCQACIMGLTFGTKREHIVRAALECMAYQSKDVLDVMEKESGIKIKELKVDGGACVNDFLLQFQSDLIRCPVQRFQTGELTALGAAYLAGIACGFWNENELEIQLNHEFYPLENENRMIKLYEQWRSAVSACMSYKMK